MILEKPQVVQQSTNGGVLFLFIFFPQTSLITLYPRFYLFKKQKAIVIEHKDFSSLKFFFFKHISTN